MPVRPGLTGRHGRRPAPSALRNVYMPGSVTSGVVLPTPYAVRLVDAASNNITKSGFTVTASVVSGTATLANNTAITDAQGIATFTSLTITGSGGVQLRATSPLLTAIDTATFTVQVAATKVVITVQPAGAVDNTAFTTQMQGVIQDATDTVVPQAGVVIQVVSTDGTRIGTTNTVVTDAFGGWTYVGTGFGIDVVSPPTSVTLTVSSPGLTSAVSNPITIQSGASYLSLTTQPTTGTDNQAFSVQPVAQLRTSGGAPLAQAGVVVTAQLLSGIGALIGTVTATTDANGTATFTNLGINDTVDDYLPTLAIDWDMAALPGLAPAVVGGWQAAENAVETTLYSNLSLVSNPALTITGSHNAMRTTFQTTTLGGFTPVNVYPAGFTWPTNNGSFDYEFTVLFDPLFDNNGAGANVGTKLWFFGKNLPQNNHFIGTDALTFDGGPSGGALGGLWLQIGLQSPTLTYKTNFQFTRGVATKIRVQGLANTPGTANGQLRVWADGVPVLLNTGANNAPTLTAVTNVQFFSAGQTAAQDRLQWYPTYGGGSQSPPIQQYIDCGHIRVFTSP